uniref:Protein kinase domain-containing protein n=1 Tax=Glossina brevipalpis TaxID=37001 RepID=A0A1A9WUU8_9MUSC
MLKSPTVFVKKSKKFLTKPTSSVAFNRLVTNTENTTQHSEADNQKGCIAYTGVDMDSGQLLYIIQWNIKCSQIEQHCSNGGGKCLRLSSEHKCSGNHRVDDVIASIEKQVTALSQLHNKNLIQYESVHCIKRIEGLGVYLVQDFILGTSVFSISSSLGWCVDGVRGVAKGVLDASMFLHNKGVSHSHLLDSTLFMDNTGTIRCPDCSLVPNLSEFMGGSGERSTQGDLPALVALVDSLMTTHRILLASELLGHPFLRSSLFNNEEKENILLTKALINPNTRRKLKTSAVPPLNSIQRQETLAVSPKNTFIAS